MKSARCSLFIFLFCWYFEISLAKTPNLYTFGGVLNSNESVVDFEQDIINVQEILPRNITLRGATVLIHPNPVRTALAVCKYLIGVQVNAVIVSHPIKGNVSPASVSYTCGIYHIPVIGISSRHSAFSDKNSHPSFLRTVPPYSFQADVWIDILDKFKYRRVIFIHSADADGNAILVRFQTGENKIKFDKIIEFQPGVTSILSQLQDAQQSLSRVFLLYANAEDANVIFRDAEWLNMTDSGSVWLVSEQALEAANVFSGVLGLRLINASDEAAHIHDSVQILAMAIEEMDRSENITEAPNSCDTNGSKWKTENKFFNYVRKQILPQGKTGNVTFDKNGDRLNAEYELINVHNGELVVVGQYFYSMTNRKMELNDQRQNIIWPGNLTTLPCGCIMPTKLRVVTLVDKPFVMARPLKPNGDCIWPIEKEIRCSKLNGNGIKESYCCRGYCIELLYQLAERMNFTYELQLGRDGTYGAYEKVNGSDEKVWTGLMGELVNGEADMIVAPFTNNQDRAQAVDFSKPFKYHGITILEKRYSKSSGFVSFLQPFQGLLWILVLISVHIVALVLFLLDRFSPFGQFKLGCNSDALEKDVPKLSSAIWFAWGVLLNSGIGEGTPRSFSARVLGMVWAGFAMIIVASYTANLAAFLVLEKPETSLSGINDARLRNSAENFTYATVKGSAVDMYFQKQVELSNMYRNMEKRMYNTAEEAILDVKSGKLKAFIWDSPRLEYEAGCDCQLITASEMFGRSEYGIALKKKSPWVEQVTSSILHFQEQGILEELEKNWILNTSVGDKCQQSEKAPVTLGLQNMAGVFILVAAGVAGGVVLIVIEIVYKKRQIDKQKRIRMAHHAANKWKGEVKKRKTLKSTVWSETREKAKSVGDINRQENQNSLHVSFLKQEDINSQRYPNLAYGIQPYIECDDAEV